ncbi:hypothetical protein GGR26_003155 [Lewinella marina]|uniref:hypothetical protein n=1 Tax=Neolewinella marina TaxID=438751 RepID=UPI00142F77C7|nr:hypothetical protein [Neolewinella marina]NJB87375.1 hypothetical protein [Neolewinella marina]
MAKRSSSKNVDLKPDLSDKDLRGGGRDHIVIHGIVGEEEDGRVKVYLNYELDAYVMLPTKHITSRERTKDDTGVELSILHFDKNVKVEVVRVTRDQVESDFLEEALMTASSGQYPSADSHLIAFTPATPTITRTITLATKYLCTKSACRVTVVCTLVCTVICPKPWTKNWFCP